MSAPPAFSPASGPPGAAPPRMTWWEKRRLFKAIRMGDADQVRSLLERLDPDARTFFQGHTPLMVAVIYKRAALVRILLDAGCRVGARNRLGVTVLDLAASGGDTALGEMLLASGADVNEADGDRWSPLHHAAFWGKTDFVKLLLRHGARNEVIATGKTPRQLAEGARHTDTVHVFEEISAYLNSIREDKVDKVRERFAHLLAWNLRDSRGRTPLHVAAGAGQAAVFDLLLGAGGDIDAPDGRGLTPLWEAVHAKELGMVRKLVQAGADLEASGPLRAAVWHIHPEMVEVLLAAGANAGARDPDGRNLLGVVLREVENPRGRFADSDVLRVVTSLAKAGVPLGERDKQGHSALYCVASLKRFRELEQVLLDAGAEPDEEYLALRRRLDAEAQAQREAWEEERRARELRKTEVLANGGRKSCARCERVYSWWTLKHAAQALASDQLAGRQVVVTDLPENPCWERPTYTAGACRSCRDAFCEDHAFGDRCAVCGSSLERY